MKIKQFVAVTLIGMSIAGAANAQSWSRDESSETEPPFVTGRASQNVRVEFFCGRSPTEARLLVFVPWQSRFNRLADEGYFTTTFEVDGQSFPLSLQFTRTETEAVFATSVAADDESFAEKEDLNNLVYALQSGRAATITSAQLGLASTLPLGGSMEALRGVYLGCGMRMTGTDPWGYVGAE